MFLHETFAQFRPHCILYNTFKSALPSADINSMKRCFAATIIRSWVFEELVTNGIAELTKLNNLLRSQSY